MATEREERVRISRIPAATLHQAWAGRGPGALAVLTIEGELIVLADRSAFASGETAWGSRIARPGGQT